MKVLALSLAIVFVPVCSAQTKPPASPRPLKTQLAECRADADFSHKALEEAWNQYYQLEARNKELETKNAELTQKDEAIKKAATELLENDKIVYPAAAKLVDDYHGLVKKYNDLLATAQGLQSQLNAATYRQQRVANALALYSLMPKYTPPQTINLQVTNCVPRPLRSLTRVDEVRCGVEG